MIRRLLTVTLLAQVLAISPALADLTGEWTDENGACYKVRQLENRVYWQMDASPRVINVFSGLLVGSVMNGRWADLPGYQLLGSGTLSLRVESDVRMVKITAGSGASFRGSVWTRGACSGCGWKNGHDPAAPPHDPGRGLLNRNDHYNHAMTGGGANGHRLVAERLATLETCLDSDQHARLYGDVSVLIAETGRRLAGWVDGMDQSARSDPGRGSSNWQLHHDYAAGGGGGNVSGLVGQRMQTLSQSLGAQAFAQLYAEVSVLLAKYGTGTR